MRAVLQRVLNSSVSIEGECVGEIGKGLLVLVAVDKPDNKDVFKYMFEKIINLRIFEDENNKLNLSVSDLGLEVLIVPNFTIYADARKGRRPNFVGGASPDEAEKIFNDFLDYAKSSYDASKVAHGIFRADMQVSLVNDGPITIILDSDKII